MLAKLTLAGLDRWTKSGMYEGSASLWDLLNVPAGVSKETLVNAILYKSFEFPVIYMDAESVREQIGLLSDMWQDSMTRTWEALTAEYNPIHNFDRYEEYTDEHSGESSSTEDGAGSTTGETSATSTGTGKTSSTESGTGKTTGETSDTDTGTSTQTGTGKTTGKTTTKNNGTTSGNGTQEQAYMGDTATTYNPAQKTTDTNGSTTSDTGESTSEDSSNTSSSVESTGTKTGTSKGTSEDSRTASGTSEDTREQSGTSTTSTKDSRTASGTESGTSKHSGHLYGNIGVTTSQQMLNAELDLRMTRNWYDLWADKFTGELCVGIY